VGHRRKVQKASQSAQMTRSDTSYIRDRSRTGGPNAIRDRRNQRLSTRDRAGIPRARSASPATTASQGALMQGHATKRVIKSLDFGTCNSVVPILPDDKVRCSILLHDPVADMMQSSNIGDIFVIRGWPGSEHLEDPPGLVHSVLQYSPNGAETLRWGLEVPLSFEHDMSNLVRYVKMLLFSDSPQYAEDFGLRDDASRMAQNLIKDHEKVIADMLTKFREGVDRACDGFGLSDRSDRWLATVPANLDNVGIDRLKRCMAIAGMGRADSINIHVEPRAAMVSAMHELRSCVGSGHHIVLTVDSGGGTTDVVADYVVFTSGTEMPDVETLTEAKGIAPGGRALLWGLRLSLKESMDIFLLRRKRGCTRFGSNESSAARTKNSLRDD
jgi:hypothetical protein